MTHLYFVQAGNDLDNQDLFVNCATQAETLAIWREWSGNGGNWPWRIYRLPDTRAPGAVSWSDIPFQDFRQLQEA